MPKPTLRRRIVRTFFSYLGLDVLAALVVTFLQRGMIYFPTVAEERVLLAVGRNEGFGPWLNAAGQLVGWQRRGPTRPARGQVLVVHGNAGYALDRTDYAKALQEVAAFDVFILEFPGYGSRPGKPSQKTILTAADEALMVLRTNGPVYLIGESLGSGVAAHLAGAHPAEVAGMLLFTPYNNMTAVAQHHMPAFPVRWMLWDRFPSDESLKQYRGPLGFLLAGNDEVVPDKFGRRLHDGYQGPKKLWEAPQTGHNNVHQRPAEWWKQVVAFWDSSPPVPPGK